MKENIMAEKRRLGELERERSQMTDGKGMQHQLLSGLTWHPSSLQVPFSSVYICHISFPSKQKKIGRAHV